MSIRAQQFTFDKSRAPLGLRTQTLAFADTYLDYGSDQRVVLGGRLVGYVEHSCLIIVLRNPVKPTEG